MFLKINLSFFLALSWTFSLVLKISFLDYAFWLPCTVSRRQDLILIEVIINRNSWSVRELWKLFLWQSKYSCTIRMIKWSSVSQSSIVPGPSGEWFNISCKTCYSLNWRVLLETFCITCRDEKWWIFCKLSSLVKYFTLLENSVLKSHSWDKNDVDNRLFYTIRTPLLLTKELLTT